MKDTLLYLRHEILGVQRTSKEGDSWNNQEATAEYYAKIRRVEEDLREAKGPLMESLYGAREKEEGEGTMAPLYVHSGLSVSDNGEQVPVAWEEQTGSSATSAHLAISIGAEAKMPAWGPKVGPVKTMIMRFPEPNSKVGSEQHQNIKNVIGTMGH